MELTPFLWASRWHLSITSRETGEKVAKSQTAAWVTIPAPALCLTSWGLNILIYEMGFLCNTCLVELC